MEARRRSTPPENRPSFSSYWRRTKEDTSAKSLTFVQSDPSRSNRPLPHNSTISSTISISNGGDKTSGSEQSARDKRRAQVRRAQIQHRARKADYVRQLESDIQGIRERIEDAERKRRLLRSENQAFRARLGGGGDNDDDGRRGGGMDAQQQQQHHHHHHQQHQQHHQHHFHFSPDRGFYRLSADGDHDHDAAVLLQLQSQAHPQQQQQRLNFAGLDGLVDDGFGGMDQYFPTSLDALDDLLLPTPAAYYDPGSSRGSASSAVYAGSPAAGQPVGSVGGSVGSGGGVWDNNDNNKTSAYRLLPDVMAGGGRPRGQQGQVLVDFSFP